MIFVAALAVSVVQTVDRSTLLEVPDQRGHRDISSSPERLQPSEHQRVGRPPRGFGCEVTVALGALGGCVLHAWPNILVLQWISLVSRC